MDQVPDLLRALRATNTPALSQIQVSKFDIVDILENEHIEDRRVLAAFLDIAENTLEDKQLRIHVLRAIRENDFAADDQRRIVQTLSRLMSAEPDQVVRAYAAMALSFYSGDPAIREAFKSVLLDATEDINMRSIAFNAIVGQGSTMENRAVMLSLGGDRDLARSASRVLQEWGVGEAV